MIDLLGHYQAVYTPKINLGEGSKLLIKCDNITTTYVPPLCHSLILFYRVHLNVP